MTAGRWLFSAPVSSSQTVGELVTVEFVTVGDGLAPLITGASPTALQRLTASHNTSQLLTAVHWLGFLVAPEGG